MDDDMRAELERVREAMKAKEGKDTRAPLCGCGHPIGKHASVQGRVLCNALQGTCRCRESRPVAVTPNARIFCFKTDESGSALVKGWLKAEDLGLGDRVAWTTTCVDCDKKPSVVVEVDGGATNEPRCTVHR